MTDDGLLRIEGWARDGLTDEQIAQNMGIHVATLYRWQEKYSDICDALKRGKAPIDQKVENALLKRAIGYQYEEIVTDVEEYPTSLVDENGDVITKSIKKTRTILKTALPDTTAQIFWLKNRRPDRWRDKPITAEDTSTMEKLDAMLAEVKSHAFNS